MKANIAIIKSVTRTKSIIFFNVNSIPLLFIQSSENSHYKSFIASYFGMQQMLGEGQSIHPAAGAGSSFASPGQEPS